MTPVETVWIGMVIVFAVVGAVRGFLKELGVTLVLVVTLFGLTRLENYIPIALGWVATAVNMEAIRELQDNAALWLIFYLLIILGATFIAYQGYVIKYPGADPKGVQGILLSLMIGVVNGYLVAGSLWYYVDKYKQPVMDLNLLQGPYSALAAKLIGVLPPIVLGPYLPFLVIFMVILLVLK